MTRATEATPSAAECPPSLSPALLSAESREPLRAELFGPESLEAYARELAACPATTRAGPGRPLLRRFDENSRLLRGCVGQLAERARGREPTTTDVEWLLDNWYILEEVLRDVRRDLPVGYFRTLPKATSGPLAGYPRVYALALALVAHTDSALDEDHLRRFVTVYQTVTPLTIGELWAVPIMVRLALIENLRRLAERILTALNDRIRAERWAANRAGGRLPPTPELTDAFLVRLLHLLREAGPPEAVAAAEAELHARGVGPAAVVARENQRQAVDQVSVGNAVTSLRLLALIDWGKFFERASLAEALLRQDPAGVYARQDFATRDAYRRAVEDLSRRSGRAEEEVVRLALAHAAAATDGPARHVGYYLVGEGKASFRRELGYRPRWGERAREALLARPQVAYFGGALGLTAALAAALAWATGAASSPWLCVLAFAAALLPASELAVFLTNTLTTWALPPRVLPKLDFKEGIPSEWATCVVVPCMLARPAAAAELVRRLEVHYFANPDAQLRFALLTDFPDAAAERLPTDEAALQAALDGVAALNRRHAAGGPPRFFLFHRARRWNASQCCWMGWERKRGKLSEFNRLLRGARDTGYTVCSSDPSALGHIRFVLTLDADTRLPQEAARRLVGTLAHPLNRPRLGPGRRRVVAGYAVLQPRVSFHLGGKRRTLFSRLWAASAGVDPYSAAVSDVYQDLFGVGSFTGKGLYDVDAFEAATGAAFPDDHILSHDLIEGNYARCGLVSDVEVFDDFPSRYHAFARREHRWARGDWQLLPWLGRTVPLPPAEPGGPPRRAPNCLPLVERWKVLDNLRRSLVPPGLVLMLLLGWTVLPGPAWLWGAAALAVLLAPLAAGLLGALAGALGSRSLSPVRGLRHSLAATAGQALLGLVFLADLACQNLDAVARTLARLYWGRRRLLEWETAAATEGRLGPGLASFWRSMWPAVLLVAAAALLVAVARPGALAAAAPFLLAWALSPLVAYRVSQPPRAREAPLSDADRRELRQVARLTWGFFETFVGPEDHWLPPDNFQEAPGPKVAHRTSPTNVGMLLLSTLAARDLGYLSLAGLADRLEKTFDTLDCLEKSHGHIYNWYDSATLKPLQPAYISTVDSGNLAACLIVLKQGLLDVLRQPWPGPALAHGLADTLAALSLALRDETRADPLEVHRALRGRLEELEHLLSRPCAGLPEWRGWLAAVAQQAEELAAAGPRQPPHDDGVPRPDWPARLVSQARNALAELDARAPWIEVLAARQEDGVAAGPEEVERAERWRRVRRRLTDEASLASSDWAEEAASDLLDLQLDADIETKEWLGKLAAAVRRGPGTAGERLRRLAERAERLAAAMDFTILYKPDRHLFAIGYTPAQGRLDDASYDLLASEARLTSLLAVARGDAPRQHWFHLGRLVTRVGGELCLISWGGTMFEYLMPELILPCYPDTLLAQSRHAAVRRQIAYGRQRGVPWGISESGFASRNASLDYQYQAFGVPGLGLKRGLAHDLVVAPYATALATTVCPTAAAANFRRLAEEGGLGAHGFYEAIDYTAERLPAGQRSLTVRSYMAHHQGMSLVALANCLLDDLMPRRFHAEPMARAADLLLQERVPFAALPEEPGEAEAPAPAAAAGGALSRRLTTPDTPGPRTHLLSNGQYVVLVTNAGGGYSACRGLMLSRWREDHTRDAWGPFLYLRDLDSGVVWSAGHQPVCRPAEAYEVIFSPDKADFRRLDDGVLTHLEVTVPPERNVEVRRLKLTNQSDREREIEVTSYIEVVLATQAADAAHPAFGKLFIETEWDGAHQALLARRRPRSADQQPLWAVHVLARDGGAGETAFETDRERFLGRGRGPAAPAALEAGAALSGTVGPVLDPIFSLRLKVRLRPEESATVAFTTGLADSHAAALALADHYRDLHAVLRAFELAWAHSRVELRHLQLPSGQAHLYQRLAAHLLVAGPALRGDPAALAANRLDRTALWRLGVSGDLPILLVRVGDADHLPLVRQLLAAHAYWRLKGLEADLVILNDRPTTYQDEVHTQLQLLVRTSDSHALVDQRGGVFLRQADQLGPDMVGLLLTAARVVLRADRGLVADQLERAEAPVTLPDELTRPRRPEPREVVGPLPPEPGLLCDNGTGGFTPDGREYVVRVCEGRDGTVSFRPPPAPWVNVLANPSFGCLVSETGVGYTWAVNSQAYRLTPWANDPVSDPPGEVLYLRDEESGVVWTPTPLPLGSTLPTRVRHGQGYTAFEQQAPGLAVRLTVFVAAGAPVKVLALRVRNDGARPRRLSATYYAEWVLGTAREQAAQGVVTEVDADTGALLARCPLTPDLGGQVAFADVSARPRSLTADRTEFLGRNGSVAAPAALRRAGLSGRVGVALDPCAALLAPFDLSPGEEKQIVFLLGAAADVEAARRLAREHRDAGRVEALLAEAKAVWDRVTGAVQVATPEPTLNVLVNRWLPYQVLSCRVWGRSALYQSGGAYGFRDQLQDALALVYGAPQEARAHLIRAAGRQFVEGDVQHWWHPPSGRGVRTHFSDDYLWLPFVVSRYVTTTGDDAVLDERAPYLTAPRVPPDREDDYGLPAPSGEDGTLYDHCARALEHGKRFGPHGLPLMGGGDWNDGMNRVGAGGKGESVWVGWFLIACLRRFADVADRRGDHARAQGWRADAERLRQAVEDHAWDGSWYLRAWFDDGTPLGSSHNDECRIDSIAQSWAVLSGAGEPERARRAVAAAHERLVQPDAGLVLLFTPPFDDGPLQPGYVKGYLPGVRENGGQYTHAACWLVEATAQLGQGDRAGRLLAMLNPALRSASPEGASLYKVEPYVLAADLYSEPPHVGRGGWTWYTGSAAWFYRVVLETILGLRPHGDTFEVGPCVPAAWDGFELTFRRGTTSYRVRVENPGHKEGGVAGVWLDGRPLADRTIPLSDDGATHEVRVVIG
jgi:cyclic beta-1,2-glucan synthetase